MAEIEISGLERQCLDRRLAEVPIVRSEVAAWETLRNDQRATVGWRFTTTKARSKLEFLYPSKS